jgi:hypothetical protein
MLNKHLYKNKYEDSDFKKSHGGAAFIRKQHESWVQEIIMIAILKFSLWSHEFCL